MPLLIFGYKKDYDFLLECLFWGVLVCLGYHKKYYRLGGLNNRN